MPPGVPVVETVKPGSAGDQAGLSPGDVILAINNHPIAGAGGIATAIRGLHSGDHVTMEINHGSAVFELVATLGAPPAAYP
jgi:S1-C subfamily serine protease